MEMLVARSSIEAIQWPAIPARRGAALLAMQFQLERSQWWPPDTIRRHQFRQLDVLLRHAFATVPFYRRRLHEAGIDPAAGITDEDWARIPVLSRRDIQEAGKDLHSRRLPPRHGKAHTLQTSGSTGMPLTALGTQLTQFFWLCFTLRDQLWQRFDLTKKLAAIRYSGRGAGKYPDGLSMANWGPSTAPAYPSGPAVFLSIDTPVPQQVEWLQRQDPEYLITFPSNLEAIIAYCRDQRIALPKLRAVETLAEVLYPETREACREVWGVRVADIYSAQETGYIALQCPDHEHYHVQSENGLVEVVDEDGGACGPGETGRVVVTPLHNFAMPLIRYDVGDYAVVGEPCPCGRGLPVLKRILGRVRNMLTFPSGEQRWPIFNLYKFGDVAPVRQVQVVQKGLDELEVRLVVKAEMGEQDEERLRDVMRAGIGGAFRITFTYHDHIPRSKGGKFEEFRSELVT
jgi:phenylacetate-CoA ligase